MSSKSTAAISRLSSVRATPGSVKRSRRHWTLPGSLPRNRSSKLTAPSRTARLGPSSDSTPESERAALRKNPPHLLLTNYMMLEYLLVRPADRDHLFANHRCRFLVLDEIHTYRGNLGANIALLVRRVRAHLVGANKEAPE